MQLDPIDLRLLRVFQAIADHDGFAGAQAHLGLTASTLSIHLGNLEKRLGVVLCQRGRGGFRLTGKGRQLQAAARRLFLAMEDFRAEAAALRDRLSGELRLGVNDNTLSDPRAPLSEAMRRFAGRDAEVHVSLTVDEPGELTAALLDSRLNAAIGAFPRKVAGLAYSPLYGERHSLYCAAGHAFFDRPDAAISNVAVATAPLVGRSFDLERDLTLIGAAAQAATVDNMEAQATLVLSGAYLGFLPDHFAAQWVRQGRMRAIRPADYRQTLPMQLALRSGAARTPVLEAFLEDLFAANNSLENVKVKP
ncbi:DNA-binding transcriptional regulator, LysR family [Tistlia consotensis]|uniref:DNA-binding transcriptional regulator, LysR family n=1 Tax=Tistlia consotensis USBA 355 TaxID=560819 RepID=A0A1Y6BYI2_9PROT|nr:LysR family transcriptional regulator [Tistlia consotensis]SMF36162.1 DNA-binding transcriptional regulator, LysR family [Tistlia consotensis USBA 355]SNR71554.1 DNA-binding transcriptional regulator, LysR family [Tistlia consotensis]